MSGTFSFCPDRIVPETLPPDRPATVMSMNGWEFVGKPNVPYRRKWRLTLYGLRWYMTAGDAYDTATNVNFNARRLEQFYQENETWGVFSWTHPHGLGTINCRFASPVTVPKALEDSGGLLGPLEITLVEHNPAYA